MNMQEHKKKRHKFMQSIREKQPYDVTIEGIHLNIGEDVFPSDLAYNTRYLAKAASAYTSSRSLDMGCGCGFIALYLRKMGVPDVWAIDIHEPAIQCAKNNIELNLHLGPINILQGDLFLPIPEIIKFDLIIFNHPLFPTVGLPVFGNNPDGGFEILNRFFADAKGYLTNDGKILVPYSSIAEVEHNPKFIAEMYGYKVMTIFETLEPPYLHHVYEFSKI